MAKGEAVYCRAGRCQDLGMSETLVGKRKYLDFAVKSLLLLVLVLWASPATASRVVFDVYRWGSHISTNEIQVTGGDDTW